jgi:hypothetical protein
MTFPLAVVVSFFFILLNSLICTNMPIACASSHPWSRPISRFLPPHQPSLCLPQKLEVGGCSPARAGNRIRGRINWDIKSDFVPGTSFRSPLWSFPSVALFLITWSS